MRPFLPFCVALALAAAGAAHAASEKSGRSTTTTATTSGGSGRDAGSAAHQRLARDVAEACEERAALEAYFRELAASQTQSAREANQSVPEEQWRRFEDYLRAELLSRVDDYVQFVVTIDATHFSDEELKAMATFCRTPIGRRISATRVRIEAETFSMRQQWLETTVRGAMTRAAERMQPQDRGL
jgi:hypothetical protein